MAIIPSGSPQVVQWPDAPWMAYALAELGVRELPGDADNPRVLEYHAAAGGRAPDSVPWCSAFACYCVEKAGLVSTRKKNARSWLRWGKETTAPFKGCIVIFSRPPKPASGHVGFYMGATAKGILVLGGNQKQSVCIAEYPASRLLAYRAALAR